VWTVKISSSRIGLDIRYLNSTRSIKIDVESWFMEPWFLVIFNDKDVMCLCTKEF